MTYQLQQPQHQVNLRIPAIERYAYCLCLHVKPTTIFIAVFKLIRALLFASMILNNEFTTNLVPDDRYRATLPAVWLLVRTIQASFSAAAIYAVVSGKARLLIPFCTMHLVDFLLAFPAIYVRDFDPSFFETYEYPSGFSPPNRQITHVSSMLFSTITMILKSYFLCVVWNCYRYLRLIELITPIRMTEVYPHMHHTPRYPIVRVVDDTGYSIHHLAPPPYETIVSNMKLPNYEEAMKSTSTNIPNPTTREPATSNESTLPVNNSVPTAESKDNDSEIVATRTNLSQGMNVNHESAQQSNSNSRSDDRQAFDEVQKK